jgi:hypothetical protein
MKPVGRPFIGRISPLVKYQSPSILWGLFILLILLLPGSKVENILLFEIIPADKMIHFILFLILSLFNTVGWFKYKGDLISKGMKYLKTILYCGFFAGATELLQMVANTEREADWLDFLTNILGILSGILIFKIIYKK